MADPAGAPARVEMGGPLCPRCARSCRRETGALVGGWHCVHCGWVEGEDNIVEPDPGTLPTSSLARRYARLRSRRLQLEKVVEQWKQEQDDLEKLLSERLLSEGVSKVTIDDGVTVGLREETWAALVVPEDMTNADARFAAVNCLLEMGREQLVTFNYQSMRKLVTEMADEDGNLPEPLGRYIKAVKTTRIGVTNGG